MADRKLFFRLSPTSGGASSAKKKMEPVTARRPKGAKPLLSKSLNRRVTGVHRRSDKDVTNSQTTVTRESSRSNVKKTDVSSEVSSLENIDKPTSSKVSRGKPSQNEDKKPKRSSRLAARQDAKLGLLDKLTSWQEKDENDRQRSEMSKWLYLS